MLQSLITLLSSWSSVWYSDYCVRGFGFPFLGFLWGVNLCKDIDQFRHAWWYYFVIYLSVYIITNKNKFYRTYFCLLPIQIQAKILRPT